MSHTRVAVAQLDFHPAAVIQRRSLLEDPLFRPGAPNSLLPASGLPPAALEEPLRELRARVRHEHNRQLLLKLGAVLDRCRAWGVQLLVLPEYAVAPELLLELAGLAPEIVIVAGTHSVERHRAHIYAKLGWTESPPSGSAVAPVLHRGCLLALQPKLSASKTELGSLTEGETWGTIDLSSPDSASLPGPLGVMICLDFLYRERPEHRLVVGPKLDLARFLAVPSYTPWHSAGEFAAEAWQEARRYGRPVLWANTASQGGSSIFADEGRLEELHDFPRRVGLLERGDEGLIVVDVDLDHRRAGDSTRYGGERVVKPVALASLVYRHQPLGERYATWLEELEPHLGTMTPDETAAAIKTARELLGAVASSLGGGQARSHRLRRLLAELDHTNRAEEFRQFTREVLLPKAALPLAVLRRVWAKECAEIVFEWMRTHRDEGLEEVEKRLREAGQPKIEPGQWTGAGRAALRETAQAIRTAPPTKDRPARPVEPVRVPLSAPLHQHELSGEGLTLVFRREPHELARYAMNSGVDADISPAPPRKVDRESSPWSAEQLACARQLCLLERASGRLDATAVGVHGEDGSAVLVCVREGAARVLLAPAWSEDAGWLRARAKDIARVAASCCDALRWRQATERDETLDVLDARFDGARATIDAALEFQLRELGQASTHVLARVDDTEPSVDALDALDAWLARPDQVALVMGAFGTGKSTLLAQWCQARWRGEGPLPLLANLATLEHRPALELLLLAAGLDPESRADQAALSLLIREGRLIPCFDGFDEMVTRLVLADIPARMAELLAVAGSGSASGSGSGGKVLVASRDHYFSTTDAIDQNMQRALAIARVRGQTRVRLQPFGQAQIREVIQDFIQDPERRGEVLRKIDSTYDLNDLVQTPMLLNMVLQTIDELPIGARVGSASVYERYLERFLDHAAQGDEELFSPEQKRAFAEVLAAELWREGATSLAWAALHQSIMAGLHEVLPTDVPPEAAFLEIQGGTFLVREGKDGFRFAHKSFLEFFVAKGLLTGLVLDPGKVLDTAPLTPEVAAFVAELLRGRGTQDDDPAIVALRRWLVSGRELRLRHNAAAAANALRLLRDVGREFGESAGWLPEHADLRLADLRGETLSGLRLRSARLGRACLLNVDFGDADLRGASLQDADLRSARFWRTQLDEATFERADLSGVEGHACSLRGTSFRRAQMQRGTWTGCDWGEAEFELVGVGPTILGDRLSTPIRRARVGLERGHIHSVTLVAWSPDGRYLASAADDHSLRIWDADNGQAVASISVSASSDISPPSIACFAWSADSRRIAAVTHADSVQIWDAASGQALSSCALPPDSIAYAIACSPHGWRVASTSVDGPIQIRDPESGQVLVAFDDHSDFVAALTWSPDGRRLASILRKGTVHLWDIEPGQTLATIDLSLEIDAVAWSPDGQRLALSSTDESIRIWAADTDSVTSIDAPSVWASFLAWSPDGRALAAATKDDHIHIWDIGSGRSIDYLTEHSKVVNAVAWSPDSSRIASASGDRSVRIFDARSARELPSPNEPARGVTAVAWIPQSRRFVSGCDDGSIRLWAAEPGPPAIVLGNDIDFTTSLACSPDGQRIVSTSLYGPIRIWDALDGHSLATLVDHTTPLGSVSWSPDSRRFAFALRVSTIRIKDLDSGGYVDLRDGQSHKVNSISWSPTGQHIASASYKRSICVWNTTTGVLLATLEGRSHHLHAVAWSPDGQRIASASAEGSIHLWDAESHSPVSSFFAHSSAIRSIAWSPDSQRIVSASHDTTIRIWDAESGRPLAVYKGHAGAVNSVSWSSDGLRLVSASADGTARVWDASPPAKLPAHDYLATAVSFSPDGTHFASGSDDHTIRTFASASLTQRARVDNRGSKLWALAHSPKGEHIASASQDGSLRIWTAETLEHVRSLHGHTRQATCLAYSPSGELLASGSADRTLRLWNPATGQALGSATHGHWVNCIAFSPDGERLAAGTSDFDIRVWSVPDLRELYRIEGHSHYVTGLAWSPEGDRLVSSSWDHSLRVWDASDGSPLHQIDGHTHFVSAVAFAPDGSRFASVGADRSLRIWDAASYEQLEVFGSQDWLRSVAWSPDSAMVIAASEDHYVHVWRVEPCLGIYEVHGNTSLIRTPSGQFCLEPSSAPARLEVPRPDHQTVHQTVFHLPLAGVRDLQSPELVARSLTGQPTPSLAQSLRWAPLAWDGEVRSITLEPSS